MRFTRHARNRRRLYRVEIGEIERILRSGTELAPDERGNRRILGVIRHGRELIVVVALDNPGLVITLIERRGR